MRGTPEANSVDVHGYSQMLDLTIDKMQNKAGDGGADAGEPKDRAAEAAEAAERVEGTEGNAADA